MTATSDVRTVVVVDIHPQAALVAQAAGAELRKNPPPPDEALCVVVVSAPDEAAWLVERAQKGDGVVGAVVAWQLPEDAVLSMLEAGIPVVCGLDGARRLATALSGWDDATFADERAMAATLSAVESDLALTA